MSELIQENMTITHDGREWIAWNDQFRVSASSLEELDDAVRARYLARDDIKKNKKIEDFYDITKLKIQLHQNKEIAKKIFSKENMEK